MYAGDESGDHKDDLGNKRFVRVLKMESIILYANSEEELKENIEKRLKDGWQIEGEMKVRNLKSHKKTQKDLTQYAQLLIKNPGNTN